MLLFCYLVRRIVHADRCGILGNNLSSVHFRAHIMHVMPVSVSPAALTASWT